jgi:hypothetical protein
VHAIGTEFERQINAIAHEEELLSLPGDISQPLPKRQPALVVGLAIAQDNGDGAGASETAKLGQCRHRVWEAL